MQIKSVCLHRDGGVTRFDIRDMLETIQGTLRGNATIKLADQLSLNVDASDIPENTTFTLNLTDVQNIIPEYFRISIQTGANSLNLKFHSDINYWSYIKSDAEFLTDPETSEIDNLTVILEAYSRYLIEYFGNHIKVKKYFDPAIVVDSGDDEESETPEISEIPESPDILVVYKSGDAYFSNCSSLNTSIYTTLKLPPFEDTDAWDEPTGEIFTNCAEVCYSSSNQPVNSSDLFDIVLNRTFEDYSKLYIEADIYDKGGLVSSKTAAGYRNDDVDANNGGLVLPNGVSVLERLYTDFNYEYQIREFDISDCKVSNTIRFRIGNGNRIHIYNIWLEK